MEKGTRVRLNENGLKWLTDNPNPKRHKFDWTGVFEIVDYLPGAVGEEIAMTQGGRTIIMGIDDIEKEA